MRSRPSENHFETRWIPTAGERLYTRIGGADSPQHPLVLIHGFVLAGDYMMPLAAALSSRGHIYTLDLPGYGRSDKPKRSLTLAYLADRLAEWMETLRMHNADFLGNSFGCQVIGEFAVRHARLVDRLVLQGPTVDPGARTLRGQIASLLKNSRVEAPRLGRLMLRDYWRAGMKIIIATARMALTDMLERKLPYIQAPTLIVRGSRDALVSQEWAERIAGLLPQGQLLVMPGLAHTINYTAPVRLARAVRPFLAL